ncbi:MAG: aldo/keto reductase [Thermoproteota archaeon]|nr:aldo/keto reductase [Thermoproteota archaeon]
MAIVKRKFGWTNVDVPIIGQGTWMIENSSDSSNEDNHLAIKALQLGLDLGMTHIDTAEMYGNGKVEELIGQAIADKRREDIFLVSKVLPSNASYEGTIRACKNSLKRLKTDYLDLFLLHWPSSQYPIAETMKAMEKLVADNLIKFIGVSNFNLKELQEAEQALENERIACNQVLYHLGYRAIEKRIFPYCTKQGIAVVGYSPFGHGDFPSPKSAKGKVLEDIANRHGRTSRQVVLNFLSLHSNVFIIPKTSHPERVRENSESVEGWNLTDKDIDEINRVSPVSDYDTPLEMI